MNAKYYKDELNVYACFIEERDKEREERLGEYREQEREKKRVSWSMRSRYTTCFYKKRLFRVILFFIISI